MYIEASPTFYEIDDMPSDNNLPSTDHPSPIPQWETSIQQLVKVEKERGRLSQDLYSLAPVSRCAMQDSMHPLCGFSSLPTVELRKRSLG